MIGGTAGSRSLGEPGLEELEAFFKRFPSVPSEVIVKEDVLRLGESYSDAALQAAEGSQLKAYHIFSFDRVQVGKMRLGESLRAPEEIRIQGGPYRLRPTVIATRVAYDSPYRVDLFEGKPALFRGAEFLAHVEFPRKPRYYDDALEDGTLCSELTPMCFWGHLAVAVVLRNCHYFSTQEECLFCDMNSNFRQQKESGRQYTAHKPLDKLIKVLKKIFLEKKEPESHALLVSGGAFLRKVDEKSDLDFYRVYIEAGKEAVGHRWPFVLQTVAREKEECKRLKAAGVDVHHSNFEVWDRRLFAILCPGKEKYVGRDEWLKRVVDSVEVFGEGGVCPTFVSGVEMSLPHGFRNVSDAVKSTAEGLDFLMSHGVVPRVTQWCVEPTSALAGQPPAPLEYHVRIAETWYETWKKYNLPPVGAYGPMGPGRAVYSNSAFMDMGS